MNDVIDITQALVAIDSQSRVSNLDIAKFIVDIIQPVASKIERLEYTDPDGQCKVSLAVQIGDGKGGLALSSHMDTVPGIDWAGDPFEARVDGDRLYGLGSCDMKGPLAATIVAAQTYTSLNVTKPLTLLLSSDEETDTQGALRIAEDSEILASVRPDYCIVAEPTDLLVVNAHKAAITFIAEAEGRAAHSSTGEGINANHMMIPFLNDMWRLYRELTETEIYMDPDFVPPYPDWNIVIDNFGSAPNVTVSKSRCTVNFRYTNRLDPATVIRKVESSAQENNVKLTYWCSGDPLFTPPDSELVQIALGITHQDKPLGVPYRTDACALASTVPCVVIGPGSYKQAHTVNEWVSIEQLYRSVDLYKSFIRTVCI